MSEWICGSSIRKHLHPEIWKKIRCTSAALENVKLQLVCNMN